jgi:anti-anti-sigma factor
MNTAPVLSETLDQSSGGGIAAVVDLTECGFIDSTGLGVLVAANKRLRDLGRRLALAASHRGGLGLETGLDAVLAVYPLRATALAPVTESWNDEGRRWESIRAVNERLKQSCVAPLAAGRTLVNST